MVLNEEERQELADRLAKLTLKQARKEVRRLDPDANLKTWRNGVRREIHTMYELPNVGVRVILIEQAEKNPIPDTAKVRVKYYYIEARVEAWEARGSL